MDKNSFNIEETGTKIRFRFNLNEQAVGYILFEYMKTPWTSSEYGWHLELANITPARRGYGSFLLKEALSYLKNKNITEITVNPTTQESINFFIKHGFVQTNYD